VKRVHPAAPTAAIAAVVAAARTPSPAVAVERLKLANPSLRNGAGHVQPVLQATANSHDDSTPKLTVSKKVTTPVSTKVMLRSQSCDVADLETQYLPICSVFVCCGFQLVYIICMRVLDLSNRLILVFQNSSSLSLSVIAPFRPLFMRRRRRRHLCSTRNRSPRTANHRLRQRFRSALSSSHRTTRRRHSATS
jgi:hypothetical protein